MNGSPDSFLDIDLGAAAAAFGAGGGTSAEKKNGIPEDVDLQTARAAMDFQGALAMIRGLTFEVMHPELVPSPAPMPESETGTVLSPDGGVQVPTGEDELPEWLRPAEEAVLPAGAEPQAPADDGQSRWGGLNDDDKNASMTNAFSDWRDNGVEPPEWMKDNLNRYGFWGGGEAPRALSSGPTADEVEAGLRAAAGPGTQVLHGEEVVIPPARESRKQLSDWLSRVDLKRVALKGVEILGPAVFSAGLYEAFPQLRNGMVAVASTAFGLGALTETAVGGILMAEKRFPRLARLARLVSHVKGKGYLVMQLSASALAGMAVTDIVHHFQLHAAQQAAVGAGDGGTGWEGITDRGADRGIDTGDLRQRPEAPVVSAPSGREAPVLSASESEFVNRAGEVAEQEAREMADAAQGAAEHQRAVEAALTPQQLIGAELTGGTVWGHEEAFVKGLENIAHPNVATNALKNLAYGLEQGQEFTRIGPTDVVNLVNPDVGAKIAEAASNIVGREPSILTGVDKMLWELGVLGKHATRAVAETVIKAFANK